MSKIENLLGEGSDPNKYLEGKYFKAIGKAEWEDFRWDGSISDKKTIINNAHFVFTASPTVEQANKGKDSLITQNVMGDYYIVVMLINLPKTQIKHLLRSWGTVILG